MSFTPSGTSSSSTCCRETVGAATTTSHPAAEPIRHLPDASLNVAGVAFNDGESPIESVLVSTDLGRTWKAADLAVPDSRYAWYGWRTKVKLAFGNRQIWARAFDRLGRSQPMEAASDWNPSGYTYNAIEKIDLIVA